MSPTCRRHTDWPSVAGSRPRIGVLALQGDVREHIRMLTALDADTEQIRRPEQLPRIDGLILPGGESSVIDKLSRAIGLRDPLTEAIAAGLPVLGTCAGMILLADRIIDGIAGQQTFGGMDITVRRNAFGSQVESFETDLEIPVIGAPPVHAAFIRAPVVVAHGPGVSVLGCLPDGRVVAVRQGALIATAFHPEVTGESRIHRLFLDTVRHRQAGT